MAAQQSMIEYYEAGGPNNSQIYRTRAAEYKRKLRDEYYDNDNPRGPRALYYILKVKFEWCSTAAISVLRSCGHGR